MTITLVRHGEVDEAYHRCYNGHNDIALSKKGKEEAKRLARLLKGQTFDAIYSSDLRRCVETTEQLLNTVIPAKAGIHKPQHADNTNTLIPVSTGMTDQTTSSSYPLTASPHHLITPSPQTPIYTPALREKSWGRHEGMTFDAITEEEGLVYTDFLQWINTLDGEPYDSYIARIRTFFTETLLQTPYDDVLVITHAGVIRVLMHLLQDISLEAAFSIDFPYSAYTTLDTETWEFGAIRCA